MTPDEIIEEMFYEAAENFPPEFREIARDWLFKREIAYQTIAKLGVSFDNLPSEEG